MPHKILECEDIEKKKTYHPRDPISTLFSAVKENIKFTNITRTSYTQDQAVNIVYVIIHRTGKFRLVICKWNLTTTVQRTWVRFKQFFGNYTKNYKKHPTSLLKTPACTTRTWCAMWSQNFRRSYRRSNLWQRTQQLFQNLSIMWKRGAKQP